MAVLFGTLYVAQLALHALSTSATVDEPVHMLAGYRHLACGDYAFNPEHPPLVKQVAAIPLLAIPVQPPGLPCAAGFTSKPASFQLGNRFLVDNGVDRILVPARFAVFVFSLLLGVLIFAVARRMLGGWAPAAALGLLAAEPVLIAHGSLVTTDMAISAATLAAALALYRAKDSRPWIASASVGVAVGLMLLSKHSALVILPGLLLAFALDVLRQAGGGMRMRRVPGQVGMLAGAGLIALAMLWAGYEFRYSATPERARTVELGDFLATVGRPGVGESGSAKVLDAMGRSRLFPESYLMGLADIIGTGKRPSRILGQAYESGQWFYFPIALSLKTSIPLLVLALLGVAVLLRQGKRRELLYLGVPPGAYLLVCLTSGINIGVRHVLPVYPFLVVLAAAGAQAAWRRRGAGRWALVVLLGYHAITLLRTAPDYLPFANALWGGSERGYEVLQDANAEWGQSLKRVARDARKRGVVGDCWYAGVGAPMLHEAGQPCRLLPDGYRWVVVDPPGVTVPRHVEGTIYLSVRMLPPRGGPEYEPLVRAGPARTLAGTLLVFEGRFDLPLVAALSHARRADGLVRLGSYEEGLAEARRAVALAPDDPRTRTTLAAALAQVGRRDEAAGEAQRAEALVAASPAKYGFVRPRLDAVWDLVGRDG